MRTDKEKIEFTIKLTNQGDTYREIQEKLKSKFGSSMSNSTIKTIQKNLIENNSKDREIMRLKKELEIFKNLYFELLEKVNSVKSTRINNKTKNNLF